MANGSSGSANIAASDTAIDFHGTMKNLLLWTDTSSADLSVQLDNTTAVAAAANTVKVQAGAANGLRLSGLALDGIHVIGASAAGKVNWVAW